MVSMVNKCIILIVWGLLATVSLSYADTSNIQDQQIEARLKALSTELRCLVCQNTTLSDSNAPLAEDLRNEIRELMKAGKTDEEVTAYLVARYGDFVRYRPPVQANTALLWFGPFAILVIGILVLFKVLKKHADSHVQSEEAGIGEINE